MSDTKKLVGIYQIVQPRPETIELTDGQDITGSAMYAQNSWYQRIVQGSSSRLNRYREYDSMDGDVEVSRALDTIAEEMTSRDDATNSHILLDFVIDDDHIKPNIVATLRTALRVWLTATEVSDMMFDIARALVKYGDVYFRKLPNDEWVFVHPRFITAAVVDRHNVTKVRAWVVRADGTDFDNGQPASSYYTTIPTNDTHAEVVSTADMVWFTLNNKMSDSAPFGDSVLRPVFKAFKQKALIEDAIIIYRLVRAPERRVFYVGTGKIAHEGKKRQILEQFKNELRQQKIPSGSPMGGGGTGVEAVYNPQSMIEDYYIAQDENNTTRVEVLPGGANLGTLEDLDYFQERVFRGLRIPTSYMPSGNGENPIFNDGKIGQSYVEELRFALFIERLQVQMAKALDVEFKAFLRAVNIVVDPTTFNLKLAAPQNFGKYRQQELNNALLNTLSSAANVESLSARFGLSRYLQLSPQEMATNEKLLAEEKGIDPNDPELIKKLYGKQEDMEDMGGAGGLGDLGMPGGATGMEMMPDGDFEEGDMTDDMGEIEGGDEAATDGEQPEMAAAEQTPNKPQP